MAFETDLFGISAECAAAVTQYRVVTLTATGLKMSTGTPVAARPIGVSQQAGTTGGAVINVRTHGVTKVEASTAALARGSYVSPTSGAGSTGNTQLGGTVKATTAQVVSIGIALTSAAAAAAGNKRYVSVLLRI
jgi:hypothetical protein